MMMTYEEKIDWLQSQFPSYQKVGGAAYKPGLDTVTEFDRRLGQSHKAFRSVHVAGTNGKGSVSHMLAAGLSSCGLKVGLYTSPHLKDFRERIRIVEDGSSRLVDKGFVYDFLCVQEPFFNEFKPSFFEITTVLAFAYFASERVDIAVIETGLGGRLDSTNIITPLLSVITNIGLEHCEHLGDTLEKIAFEKAGIIKPGVPAVVGEYVSETKPVFERRALECGSRLVFVRPEEDFLGLAPDDLDLKGDYQQRNLRTVSAAAGVLSSVLPSSGIRFDKDAFAAGIRHTAAVTGLRGRWEILQQGGGKATVICDTGHNAHGLRWVAEQVDRISCDYRNVFFIFGVSRDKDIDAIASLLPHNVNYIFTQAAGRRAMSAADIANAMSDHGINGKVICPVRKAYDEALAKAGSEDLVFITGSNFVIAEIL